MKQILPFLFVLSALPLVAAADAVSDIRSTYEKFDEAAMNGDGKAAFDLLSSDSQKSIEKIRDLALNADKATLLKESMPVILSVFSIRTEAQDNPPANGPETMVLMTKDYAESSAMAEMGEITVDGDSASAVMLINGEASPINSYFVEEDGVWKADMVKQLAEAEKMLKESMPAGFGGEMIINQMAMAASSEGVDIWKPLK